MFNLIIKPISKKNIYDSLEFVNTYILGLKDLSINQEVYFEFEELIKIIKDLKIKDKRIIISLNKNMHNKDINNLKETLKKLEKLKVNGVIYYDLAVYNIVSKLKLNINLIWGQDHFTTNYKTINYWNKKNVSSVIVSSDITLKEIIEIKKNTDSNLIIPVYGNIPIFTSIRSLITNYNTYVKNNIKDNRYYLLEKMSNKKYPVIEDSKGTHIYSNYILNGIEYIDLLKENKINGILLNGFNHNDKNYLKVIKAFYNKINNIKIDKEDIEKIISEKTDTGFFEKETIYKVKRNEE